MVRWREPEHVIVKYKLEVKKSCYVEALKDKPCLSCTTMANENTYCYIKLYFI